MSFHRTVLVEFLDILDPKASLFPIVIYVFFIHAVGNFSLYVATVQIGLYCFHFFGIEDMIFKRLKTHQQFFHIPSVMLDFSINPFNIRRIQLREVLSQ